MRYGVESQKVSRSFLQKRLPAGEPKTPNSTRAPFCATAVPNPPPKIQKIFLVLFCKKDRLALLTLGFIPLP
jgi:hypothetical protein